MSDTSITSRDKILSALQADRTLGTKSLAKLAGISKQRVSQILKAAGMKAAPYQREWIPPVAPKPRVVTRGILFPASHSTCGTIGELLVAADMMARGWSVFFPLVRTTKADLLATTRDGRKVVRIEARSGVRRGDRIIYQRKPEAGSDHYAVVLEGEPVWYDPDLPSPQSDP